MEDQFEIKGENDNYLKISIDEIYGFPEKTSPFGGNDIRCLLEIKSGAFKVVSNFWSSTGDIFEFYEG